MGLKVWSTKILFIVKICIVKTNEKLITVKLINKSALVNSKR